MVKLKHANRLTLSLYFLFLSLWTLFSPRFAKEVLIYWGTKRKEIKESELDELLKRKGAN